MSDAKEKKKEYDRKRYNANREEVISRSVKWRSENRDKWNASNRKRRSENLEKWKAWAAKSRLNNIDARRESDRKRREKLDPQKEYQRNKDWEKNNPEKLKASRRRRRENLTDGYVRGLLVNRTILKNSDIPQELVNIKREHLKFQRKLNDKKQ